MKRTLRLVLWLLTGMLLGLFLLGSLFYVIFRLVNHGKVNPEIHIAQVNFGGKTKQEVAEFFTKKNEKFADTKFTFSYQGELATISAAQLGFGFDSRLLAEQAYSLGRSGYLWSDAGIILTSVQGEINLAPSYKFSEELLKKELTDFAQKIDRPAIDALFTFQNGRVLAFQPSAEGLTVDWDELNILLRKKFPLVSLEKSYHSIEIPLPTKILKPKVTTADVNNLGIRELIGAGSSRFAGSIRNRVHNITLAASRLNGILVAPGEVFSFNKALGDVSKFTGYKEAYIIKDGRTILGDGGGVCQVSTTLFRAILNSGLPIVERHAHSYRVGYYEQDSPAGFDATVYDPSFDLKFKNDTQEHILIQSFVDPTNMTLTFELYGTADGREVAISKPTVTNQVAPPEDLYQDGPNLPKGTIKQVDFKAWGAEVVFSRTVSRGGQVIINDTFKSNYRPWQAIFLRGTKEQ